MRIRKYITILTFISILLSFFVGTSYAATPVENFHDIEALVLPEKDINLQLNNLTRGCKVYLLFPTELLKYNMEKFISNNIENDFDTEKEIAEKLQKYLDKEDYIGYVDFFSNEPYGVKDNEIEFRQYCVAIGKNEVVDYYDYEDAKYVKFRINLDNENKYRVILKDYFLNVDCSSIKFMIDEFNDIKIIKVSDYPLTHSQLVSNIDEYNISMDYVSQEDYDAIERAIKLTYFVLLLVAFIIIFGILLFSFSRIRKHKQEKKDALFYKHEETEKKDKKDKKSKRKKK